MTDEKPLVMAERAGGFRVAVVLMHADRNVGIKLDGSLDEVAEHDVVGERAGAAAGLHDHRAVGLLGRGHDGQHLLHIVDVEGRHAIAMFGGMIEQLPQ